jgi:hypothetical protein
MVDQSFDEPRQALMAELGLEGCYVHVCVNIAETKFKHRIDTIPIFKLALARGIVRNDCTVLDAAALLGLLTGVEWTKTYVALNQPLPVGTIALALCYARWKSPNLKATHFVTGDLDLKVTFDPMGDSLDRHPDYKLESIRAFGLTGRRLDSEGKPFLATPVGVLALDATSVENNVDADTLTGGPVNHVNGGLA